MDLSTKNFAKKNKFAPFEDKSNVWTQPNHHFSWIQKPHSPATEKQPTHQALAFTYQAPAAKEHEETESFWDKLDFEVKPAPKRENSRPIETKHKPSKRRTVVICAATLESQTALESVPAQTRMSAERRATR